MDKKNLSKAINYFIASISRLSLSLGGVKGHSTIYTSEEEAGN